MNQLELLWEYQQADVEVDNLELSIRRSPKRQKLIKLRESYQDLQKSLKEIEEEIGAMVDRIDALKDAINTTEEQVKQLQSRIQDEPAADSTTVRAFISEAQRLAAKLSDYEQETRRIRKNAADRDRKQRDVKIRLVSAKEEFVPLRDEYDAEYKDKLEEVEKLRTAAKDKLKGIEPEYLQKYETIKQHSVPPIARLLNGQCGGCNMSFPSSVLHSIKSGKPIECENCGRMIIA